MRRSTRIAGNEPAAKGRSGGISALAETALVLADDLTGANVTAALLKEVGFRVVTVVQVDPADPMVGVRLALRFRVRPLAVVVNTSSRSVSPEEAATRVGRVLEAWVNAGGRPQVMAKRVDSTFRGQPGAELQAILDLLGERAFALVVAAYPASNRVVVQGELLVSGVAVHHTDAAADLFSPVTTSHIPTLLARQTALAVGHVGLSAISDSVDRPGHLAAAIRALLAQGRRIVVLDATGSTHLEAAAEAMGVLIRAGWGPGVCADPGPFTAAMMRRWWESKRSRAGRCGLEGFAGVGQAAGGPVLVVGASPTRLTAAQLDHLEKQMGVRLLDVDVHALVGNPDERRREHDRLVSGLLGGWSGPVTGLRTVRNVQGDVVTDTSGDRLRYLSVAVGEVVKDALTRARHPPAGLYLTGGDAAAAVCGGRAWRVPCSRRIVYLVCSSHPPS